jgi:hypothetical protein
MSHEDVIAAFKARRDAEERDLAEAALSIIEEGNYNHVTSATLLGELMKDAAEWQDGWSDFGEHTYRELIEIARAYLRGA